MIVYVHKKKTSGEVFYVGIGKTEVRAYAFNQRSVLWKRVANKYGVIVKIIRYSLTKKEAMRLERRLIKKYGRLNAKTGILCNLTDGGDSVLNVVRKRKSIKELNSLKPKNSLLTAIKYVGYIKDSSGQLRYSVKCRCECGKHVSVVVKNLVTGNNRSCGCIRKNNPPRAFSKDEILSRMPNDSRWTILGMLPSEYIGGVLRRMAMVGCKCGSNGVVPLNMLLNGKNKSCGCLFKEMLLKRITKYHPHIPQLHNKYKHMIEHCYTKTSKQYKNYGGRGITVCAMWRNGYQSFLDWALENGWKQGLCLVLKNKNRLIYSPSNCIFVKPEIVLSRARYSYRYNKAA